ncbi:MAG: GUN4 domain-containing protein [Leptolyngbyaceae cyanobacterium SL_5_14]|nr:GUN4 domain-containing protein [Leptolyngbyaceae cyanobacterium SL_5_14]
MELHELDKARVVPVILREADWENAPFSKLQAVPKNAQPVTTFPDQDAAFKFVTQQIRRVATELIERRRKLRDQQQKDIAIVAYRQKFEEFAADGEISFGEQFLLDDLQQKLKLTDADIQAIKQGILNPIANSQQVERYRQLLVKAIAQYGYPFSDEDEVRTELKLVQTHLNLSDTDIAQIEAPIIAQKQAEALKQRPTATDTLSSEKGIDYTKLRDLLKAQRWQEADRETYEVMIRAVGKKSGDWFTSNELLNFPCTDLKTIDSLWVKYSNGRFGFSVQKKIYLECGGIPDGQYHREAFGKFGDRVGWRKNKEWVFDVTFRTSSPQGHLPIEFVSRHGFARRFVGSRVYILSHRDL